MKPPPLARQYIGKLNNELSAIAHSADSSAKRSPSARSRREYQPSNAASPSAIRLWRPSAAQARSMPASCARNAQAPMARHSAASSERTRAGMAQRAGSAATGCNARCSLALSAPLDSELIVESTATNAAKYSA